MFGVLFEVICSSMMTGHPNACRGVDWMSETLAIMKAGGSCLPVGLLQM